MQKDSELMEDSWMKLGLYVVKLEFFPYCMDLHFLTVEKHRSFVFYVFLLLVAENLSNFFFSLNGFSFIWVDDICWFHGQVLCTVTLGAPTDAQRLDSLVGPPTKRFMLHYSFPPFCINEVGKRAGLNRREVGHGKPYS